MLLMIDLLLLGMVVLCSGDNLKKTENKITNMSGKGELDWRVIGVVICILVILYVMRVQGVI